MSEIGQHDPEKKHPGIEVSGEHGNFKFTFPSTPLQETALHGPAHSTAIITREGMDLLKKEGLDREDILRRIASNTLTPSFRSLGNTYNSEVREVSSAENQFKRLFSKDEQTTVIEKKLKRRVESGVQATGWETLELFDQIRPIFEKHGAQLLKPYGATQDALYVPRLHGEKLVDFLRKVQDGSERGGLQIGEMFKEHTKTVYLDSLEAMQPYMEAQGWVIDPRWRWHHYHDYNVSPPFSRGEESASVTLDFAVEAFEYGRIPGHIRGDVPRTFQNWIVEGLQVRDIVSLGESGDTQSALDLLKQHAICYDPLLVVRKGFEKNDYQEHVLNSR